MTKHWRIHPHDAGRIESLERAAGISPIVAQLLLCRGIADPQAAKTFLAPKMTELRDPELLPGLTAAADRVFVAATSGRRIVIYGDYDADGMTATAILYRCLQLLGADVGYHVPNRLEEGYGLNSDAFRKLAERGTSMVISVDCGIASVGEADVAREVGIELIVTDHHQFGDSLPDAAAIVHPALPGSSYPFAGLCGAGVAFKLAWALCCRASESKRVSDRMRSFLLMAIGIAAIGTVADVVPLVDENRVLVRFGLKSLRENAPLGLSALMQVTKLHEKPALSSEDIGFMLAPRLNAAGRLGQAQLGVELLTTDSQERAKALAEYIHELNSSRDSLERSVYLAANKQIKEQFDPKDPAFVLAGRGWHAGVIGIVAGRLAEKLHRPVVLLSVDELAIKPATGSGRSACGVNLHRAFAECGEHLITHGGHAAAAGLKVEESQIEAFRLSFCDHVESEVSAEDRVAEVRIDVEAPLSQLTLQTVQQIEQIAPFGQANPRPILCATGVEIADTPKRIGGGERHLAMKVKQHHVALRAIGFGHGEWLDDLIAVDRPIDIVYRPVINEFRGRRNVEVHLVDWRLSQQPALVDSA
ncbi:MAG: single-stranded-DNA-specific exonuclease RecJ [Planctomycetaceae bacterium]|nr:single-stranded-DNA-specific exonuclease RecJ [Planctomycetaceae bacterium]